MNENVHKIEMSMGTIYFKGKLIHRTDGPAIEDHKGNISWFINGTQYSFYEWLKLCSLPQEEKAELVLIYG